MIHNFKLTGHQRAGSGGLRVNWRAMFLAVLLLPPLPRLAATKGQAGGAGSPQAVPHVVQTATCCGLSVAVDQTNLTSIVECLPSDASCTQGIAVCFVDGTCKDVLVGSGAASIRYWKQSTVAGVPQRLDVIVGNIAAHASPTNTGWTQTQGAPLQ